MMDRLEWKHAVAAVAAGAAAAQAYRLARAYWNASSGPSRSRVLGVIPARYASSRFPGKPLVMIAGVPMIVRTYEQAKQAKTLTRLVVATDDARIKAACEAAGAEVVMTDSAIPNGTERCEKAMAALGETFDVVVNVQGDEPLIEPEIIDACVRALQASPDAVYSTPVTPFANKSEVTSASRVKCVADARGYAMYFSRGMIPGNKRGVPEARHEYLLHLGLQVYDAAFLKVYSRLPATPCQLQEDLEQLKVLEHGYKMKTVKVAHAAHGVDEPADVASIEAILARQDARA